VTVIIRDPVEPSMGPGPRQPVPGLIFQVVRELRSALDRGLAPFDVTAQQATVLIRSAQQDTTPHRLAAPLGTDTAGMTRLLDRLEAKGLLRRESHPTDRRSIVIQLTAEGQALVPRLTPVFDSVTRRLLAGLSPGETDQLQTALQRVLDNLRDDAGSAAPPG
jgi:DNA-binding MarR family transcriptional regulator